MALLKGIVNGIVPIDMITINQSRLNKKASIDKESFTVPGCRAVETKDVRYRKG
jgi:hypothetical protein